MGLQLDEPRAGLELKRIPGNANRGRASARFSDSQHDQAERRAIIASTGSRLNIELPTPSKAARLPEAAITEPGVRTDTQIRQIEADNIRVALKAANGQVSGSGSAAQLLGLKFSASAVEAAVRQSQRNEHTYLDFMSLGALKPATDGRFKTDTCTFDLTTQVALR